ncbi:MAG: 3D domain-containing protein [Pyrinomonadaceae bacterium]
MKNLVRGGSIVLAISLLAVFIYAQTSPEKDLRIANDSQINSEDNIVDIALLDNNLVSLAVSNSVSVDDEKLVTKTASVKSTGAGASRGAFSATAYCLRGKTAMGHGVRRGLIAADPRVLRLGSRVVVNGGGYSGTYLVSDTGGKIKGKRIDIWMASCSEAKRFGRRTVQIYSAN